MNILKIRRQILRNYVKTLVELEERGIQDREILYRKIMEQAGRISFEIYKREQELKRAYYQCALCKRYINKKDESVVKEQELIEELQLVIKPSKVCSVCEKEEIKEWDY